MSVADPVNLQNRSSWERVARVYAGDAVGEDDPAMREVVRARFCERLRGDRVLEVGCGPGTDAAAFAARGLRVTATDFAPAFVAIVRERYPELDVRRMDMTAPDLPAESVDGIYGFGSFVHLPRALADVTLTALRELLVPGGLLGLQVMASRKGIEEYTIDGWAGDPACAMHFSCYPEEELGARLAAAGYVDYEPVALPPSVYDTIPRLVERGIHGYQAFARRPA